MLSVAPADIDLALPVEGTVSQTVVVTVPPSNVDEDRPTDILFLLELNNGFEEQLDQFRDVARGLAERVLTSSPGTRIGLSTFRDFQNPESDQGDSPYNLVLGFTDDAAAFEDAVNNLTLATADNPAESHYAALWGALGNSWEDPLDDDEVISSSREFFAPDPGYRADSNKLIVLWKDGVLETADTGTEYSGPAKEQVLQELRDRGVLVAGVTSSSLETAELAELAQATGALNTDGSELVFTIDAGGSGIESALASAVNAVTGRVSVSLAPVGDVEGWTTNITAVTPSNVSRGAGGDVTFEVTFTAQEGRGPVDFELQARGAFVDASSVAAGFVEVVVVVDESGSMEDAQDFIGPFIQALEQDLIASGVGNTDLGLTANRYGLVGFGRGGEGNLGRPIQVGGGDFGSADDFLAATSELVTTGGREDGYAGVDFALENYEFTEGSTRIVILISDEDRDVIRGDIDSEGFVDSIESADANLVSIVYTDLFNAAGESVLAIDSQGNAYRANENGELEVTDGGRADSGAGATVRDYVATTLELDGFVAALSAFRSANQTGNADVVALFSEAIRQGIVGFAESDIDLGTVDVSLRTTVVVVPPDVDETPPTTVVEQQPAETIDEPGDVVPVAPIPALPSATVGVLGFNLTGGGSGTETPPPEPNEPNEPSPLIREPRTFDYAYGQAIVELASELPKPKKDPEITLAIDESDVPDSMGYIEGDEARRRERPEAVGLTTSVELPEPEPPLLQTQTEEPLKTTPWYWWLAATAFVPVVLWGARRQFGPKSDTPVSPAE